MLQGLYFEFFETYLVCMHTGTILLIYVLFISLSLSLFSPLKKVMLWELDLMYNAGLDVNWGAKSVAELGVSPPILSYLFVCVMFISHVPF
jgi:hypothetical protein